MKHAIEQECDVEIHAGDVTLEGNLVVPEGAHGIVVFAHGSGSSRHSVRNRFVAKSLNEAGLATLLFDLLSEEEEAVDMQTAQLRFDIKFLAERLLRAVGWLADYDSARHLKVGLFGSSTGGGAALVAAAEHPTRISTVVSRGGRPDLAGNALPRVQCQTLLIVGGDDEVVIEMNREAMKKMSCEVILQIVPGATHLFQEPGALEQVAQMAARWFQKHLA